MDSYVVNQDSCGINLAFQAFLDSYVVNQDSYVVNLAFQVFQVNQDSFGINIAFQAVEVSQDFYVVNQALQHFLVSQDSYAANRVFLVSLGFYVANLVSLGFYVANLAFWVSWVFLVSLVNQDCLILLANLVFLPFLVGLVHVGLLSSLAF